MPEKIYSPHDKLFGEIFSRNKESRGFVEGDMPQEIQPVVDLNSLELFQTKFIDEELREHRADLIFKALFAGETGYLHILLEHKSDPKKMIGLDFYRYMLNRLWRQDAILKENPKLKKVLPPKSADLPGSLSWRKNMESF